MKKKTADASLESAFRFAEYSGINQKRANAKVRCQNWNSAPLLDIFNFSVDQRHSFIKDLFHKKKKMAHEFTEEQVAGKNFFYWDYILGIAAGIYNFYRQFWQRFW